MKNQEWTYYKKEEWPDKGPWTNEPDKTQFVDEVTGLPCLTVRNWSGNWCGYVGVPESHPLHSIDYNKCTDKECKEEFCYEHSPEARVSVHGGLTFSDKCHERPEGYDGPLVCHVPDPGEPDNVWWFGFDCAHSGDCVPQMGQYSSLFRGVYRDLAYVQQECRSLALQLSMIK